MNQTRFYRCLISLSLVVALLYPFPSYSATTEEKLNACDAALNAKIQEASLCGLGVQLRQNELERVTKENAELKSGSSRTALYMGITAVITAIVTAYGVSRATR